MRPVLLALGLVLVQGCSFMVSDTLPFLPSHNPRKKSCTILDKTTGVDAAVTIVATAVALTGRTMRDTGYASGEDIELGAKIVGAPFALSYAAAIIGAERCTRGF